MTLGRNTLEGQELLSFIERVERVREEKKAAAADEKSIIAEAVARGYLRAGIDYCIKVRAMKPHDRQEKEALRETYLHAIGLGDPPPLFRMMGMLDVDRTSRESVLSAIETIVPDKGDVILRIGGEPVRLWRDKDGEVQREPWVEPSAAPAPRETGRKGGGKPAPVMPEIDEAGATELGRQYARDNRAIIENPFPFGDPRRGRFDEGWRRETGSDGMGPGEG